MKREEFLKLKVGDKVKIVDKWPVGRDGGLYFNPEMSKWLGTVTTVKELMFDNPKESCVTLQDCYFGYPNRCISDDLYWLWSPRMIEKKIEEKKPDILRVRCVESNGYDFTEGKVYERIDGCLVSDRGCYFHNLCKNDDPTKWTFASSKFELAESKERYPQIVIKQDGNTVTAYCGSAKGVAKCSPEDTFDLYTGAQLALARAFGREEKKELKFDWDALGKATLTGFEDAAKSIYKFDEDMEARFKEFKKPKNLKVKCVEATGKYFTEGKVYEWVNGELKDNIGDHWTEKCRGSDPTKWAFHNYKFELYEEPRKIKVKCVEANEPWFTVGKIYEWVDGKLTDDTGYVFRSTCRGSDPSKWSFTIYKFELVDVLRVKCVKDPGGIPCIRRLFTKGKVYERIDGVLMDDYGYGWKKPCRNDDPKYWSFVEHKFELAE